MLLFIFVLITRGHAQQLDKINAGRPDQSQGTNTVPKGALQLETGFNYRKDNLNGNNVRTLAYPSLTVRLGLLNRLELRVEGSLEDSVVEEDVRRRVRGFGPLGIGGRIHLWEQDGILPEAALTAVLTLPTGSAGMHPQNPEARVNLGLSHTLSDRLSLTYSLRYGWIQDATEIQYASNLLAELTEKLSVYVEFFGLKEEGNQAEQNADIGFLWFPWHNVQLDVSAGVGLNRPAPDYFITTGFSIRLPR